MASPAAVLSILVKAQGVQQASQQLGAVDKSGRAAAGGMSRAEAQAKRSSKALSGVGTAAKSAGLLLGAAGLAKGFKTAISEYQESVKVGGQTTAVLKSTGGAAKVTAKHIQELAGSISKKSGIDDEAIQSSENMLLTFTKVRNETGKGNKIFDQATQVVTDMSAALGQSGKSSAIQLGKALNDPIKGITALRRVGVSFTADQQKQITTLEQSGHHLEAQKLILKELKTEFAGSAEAQATASDKFKVAIGNLAEAAGAVLVPALNSAMGFLTKFFNQMVEGVGVGGALISKFKDFGGALAPFGESIKQIVGWLQQNTGVAKVLAAGLGILAGAIIAVNIAMSLNPFVAAGLAIAALVVGVVTAYREFETFHKIVDAVAHFFVSIWPTVSQAAITAFEAIKGAVRAAWPVIVNIIKTAMSTISGIFRAVWPVIKAIFEGGFTALKGIVTGGAKILSGAVDVIKGVLHGDFGEIWDGIKKIFSGGFTVLKGIITGAAHAIGQAAKTIGGAIIDAIVSAIKAGASKLVDGIKGVVSGAKNAVKGALGAINPFGDGLGFSPITTLPKAGNLMGASPALAPFAALGAQYGLHVSSGARPGAVTVSGNTSYHSSGRAIDLANGRGPDAAKLAAFRALKARYGGMLAELIYTPGGVGIKDGQPYRYTGAVAADHMDHIHVAFAGARAAGQAAGRGRNQAAQGDGIGDVTRLARGAGFKGQALINAIAIAGAESGFRSHASNRNSDGSIDRGYWQINSVHGSQSTFSPTGNARAAFAISSGGRNWHPWVTYNTGAYRRYLNQARAAAGSISGSATRSTSGGASSSAGSGAATAQKVNPLDQRLASADLAIQMAQSQPKTAVFAGGRRISSSLAQISALTAKRQLIGKRIRSIRKALKGHLSPAKRLALTQELTQRLGEHSQLGTDIAALRTGSAAADTGGDIGGGGIGADVGTGDGTDGGETDAQKQAREATEALTQAMVDHMNALQSLQDEISKQNQFATDVRTVQMGQLAKGLADFISGQIAGYGGTAGRSLTAGAGTVARY